MHGRLKVRSTEEQQKLKKLEQEKKLASYRQGMKLILANRNNKDIHQPSIQVSAQILIANPDIYTLWNFRKEVVNKLLEDYNNLKNQNSEDSKLVANEDSSEPKDEISEELKSLITYLENELELTKASLLANPKSYGAWHHRYWVLLQHPSPNWQNEFDLCNEYLKRDDRNFHVWDYRRLILKKVDVSPEDELKFSTERIHSNFSNYSSWHYRSTILKITPENVSDEVALVENAIFTDPDDSSAWYYLHWVLSHKCVTESIKERLKENFYALLKMEPGCERVVTGLVWLLGSDYVCTQGNPVFLRRLKMLQELKNKGES